MFNYFILKLDIVINLIISLIIFIY